MYQIEKIGHLLLITIEEDIQHTDIVYIEDQISKMAKADDEVVVSLNVANTDGTPKKPEGSSESNYNRIVDFCLDRDIRLYSYVYE